MAQTKWYAKSYAELATFFGRSRDTCREWVARGMPAKGPDGWDLAEVLAWLRSDGPWATPQDGDPMMVGDESPALERYRAARARKAEIEVAQLENEMVDVNVVREAMLRWASIIRRAGESLGRKHGGDATMILNDALDDCRRVVSSLPRESWRGDDDLEEIPT